MTDLTKNLGKEVLHDVQQALGDDWDSITAEQRESIAATASKYMDLQFRAKAGEDVAEKIQAVESTVKDWKVWGEFAVEDAFWKGVTRVCAALGSFLGAVAKAAIIP